ncbi:hypothetical protein B296_00033487 [Ensete ventricosum]|uniref:Uncharacterized protein n=1 Tax=Ensete ventricosum TaxID=4639 RepID=A0A426Z894_ENSVE|nr:hypothetical protein B296_00033487 [Ensete ventricosum]
MVYGYVFVSFNFQLEQGQHAVVAASDSSDRSKDKTLDQKVHVFYINFSKIYSLLFIYSPVLLIYKAYVQQLESSRLKLTQLEQELQRARQQVEICVFRVFLFLAQEINPTLWVEMVVSTA